MSSDPLDPEDPWICFCYAVTRSQILQAAEKVGRSLKDIQQATRAATGCGGCERDILELLDSIAPSQDL